MSKKMSKSQRAELKDLKQRAELHGCHVIDIVIEDVMLAVRRELFCPWGGNSSLVLLGVMADDGGWVGTRVRRSDRKALC